MLAMNSCHHTDDATKHIRDYAELCGLHSNHELCHHADNAMDYADTSPREVRCGGGASKQDAIKDLRPRSIVPREQNVLT